MTITLGIELVIAGQEADCYGAAFWVRRLRVTAIVAVTPAVAPLRSWSSVAAADPWKLAGSLIPS